LRIRPHKPQWKGNGVDFVVAMQYEDKYDRIFTPRPSDVLAIVRPYVDDRRNRFDGQYTMFDVTIEADRSIPTMRVTVPNWPANVDEAEIELWAKFEGVTPPDDTMEVGQTDPKSIDTPDGPVRFEVKGERQSDGMYLVKVFERHETDKTYDLIRVAMEPDWQPERTRRCYFTDAKTVEHNFYFRADSNLTPQRINRFRIFLTKVETIQNSADVRLPADKPILVHVDDRP
jgi:hypothetical protein